MKQNRSSDFFSEPNEDTWTNLIWDRELARAVDQISCEKFHISPAALMETAGRAVAKAAIDRGAETHPVLALCGLGNNGADGLVAARVLHDHGCAVTIVVASEPGKKASELFTKQLSTVEEMGLVITHWQPGTLEALHLTKPIIIDAVSGIGFNPPSSGTMSGLLTEASKLPGASVIAVDVPSGLAADDGSVAVGLLKAHETVTFGSSRPIHRLMPAAALCGQVTVADIGFPKAALTSTLKQRQAIWREVNPQAVLAADPWHQLPKNAHKYDRGHVLVIGGSEGKLGAPIMAGLAALRTGAGWCSLAIPRGQAPVDMPIPIELTTENFFDGTKIDPETMARFLEERRVHTAVLGPGWSHQCLDQVSMKVLRRFAEGGGTVVLDAGALHNVAPLISKVGPLPPERFILTPHHGEWLKLAESTTLPPLTPAGVLSANHLTLSIGAHIIYKNAAPVIVSPQKTSPIICLSGSNILSRAGSGDLLAGIIGAHLAVGCSMNFAAARAYTLLSRAAWMAAQDVGDDAVIATDIISRLGIAGRI
jgi:NAD(P)H-hydrate epimerase